MGITYPGEGPARPTPHVQGPVTPASSGAPAPAQVPGLQVTTMTVLFSPLSTGNSHPLMEAPTSRSQGSTAACLLFLGSPATGDQYRQTTPQQAFRGPTGEHEPPGQLPLEIVLINQLLQPS